MENSALVLIIEILHELINGQFLPVCIEGEEPLDCKKDEGAFLVVMNERGIRLWGDMLLLLLVWLLRLLLYITYFKFDFGGVLIVIKLFLVNFEVLYYFE